MMTPQDDADNNDRGSRVGVMGQLVAHLDTAGRVTGLVFVPSAGDAGYFGPGFEVLDGPDVELGAEEAFFNGDDGVAGFFARGGEIDWEG